MNLTEKIKNLRELTGAGVMEVNSALKQAKGDEEQAKKILVKKGAKTALKKSQRIANQGLIESYSHNGQIGVLLEVNCETDFVARNDKFKSFVHDLTLQIAAMKPETVEELLKQEYIRDSGTTIEELLNGLIGIIGEKIVIKRFSIYLLGE